MAEIPAIASLFAGVRVVPVLTIGRVEQAVPLARALVDGGLTHLEVTLRTDCALAAIEAIAARVPDAVPGVGTVLRPTQLAEARAAGARFAVSPGLTPALAEVARATPELPLLPGVATASEAMIAEGHGFGYVKFFPAGVIGGQAALKALAAPLPDIRFCPTGGVDAGNAGGYLALPNVFCVGGSWMAPAALLDKGDWPAISALATAASAL
jgi:2-dehydro-3-deoxyphosphogluconate aldolase/(4S)-4-hydroxy-2-oxoglutarate aldolase